MSTYFFTHRLLTVEVHWDNDRAVLIEINPSRKTGYKNSPPDMVREFFTDLERYLEGKPVKFYLPINWDRLPDFSRRVLKEVKKVRRGEIVSYGELSRRLARPDAARAVGQALARNPFPLVIPCHRVVGSDGSLTGYIGGLQLKKQLLDIESISN